MSTLVRTRSVILLLQPHAIPIVHSCVHVHGPPHQKSNSVLMQDDVDGIEAAIAAGAPLNARLRDSEFPGQTPLVCAVRLAKTRCFTMLVQLGADPFIPDDKYRDAW